MSEKVRAALKALDADKHLYDFNYHSTREEALEAVVRALQNGHYGSNSDYRKTVLETATATRS